MNDKRLDAHERTEALAHRIYLQENKPPDQAQEHWLRAEDALRKLDAPTAASRAGGKISDHLEQATLQCAGRPAIRGLAMVYHGSPEDGGKFYPASLEDARASLELPATLHLDDTAETFNLVRLLPSSDGDACFDLSFHE